MNSMSPATSVATTPPHAASLHPLLVLSLVPPTDGYARRTLVALTMPPIAPLNAPTIPAPKISIAPARRSSLRPATLHPTLPPAARTAKMMMIVKRVAAKLARKLPRHVEIDDLLGAGALGLAAAMTRRGKMTGREFEAFAEYRIRGAMLDELRRLDDLPRGARRWATQIARARRTVEGRTTAAASDAEIATELGTDVEQLRTALATIDTTRSRMQLSTTDADDDESVSAADTEAEHADDRAIRAQLLGRLDDAISVLPERVRLVLSGIYVQGRTLKDLALMLGVTESRVCQIHGEAIGKLRAAMNASDDEEAPSRGPKSGRRVALKSS